MFSTQNNDLRQIRRTKNNNLQQQSCHKKSALKYKRTGDGRFPLYSNIHPSPQKYINIDSYIRKALSYDSCYRKIKSSGTFTTGEKENPRKYNYAN